MARLIRKTKANPHGLTKRERLFIQYLCDPTVLTQKEAAIKAGYSVRSAEMLASDTLRKPKIQQAYCEILEAAGLSDPFIAQAHKDLVTATKVVSLAVNPKPNSENEAMDAGPGTMDFVDVPDHMARAKGIDMYYRVRGRYSDKVKIQVSLEDAIDSID
jgi:phage terminase small subunit